MKKLLAAWVLFLASSPLSVDAADYLPTSDDHIGSIEENKQLAKRGPISESMHATQLHSLLQHHNTDRRAENAELLGRSNTLVRTIPIIERQSLTNKLVVALARTHGARALDIRIVVNAGYAADSFARPGTAKLVFASLERGTKNRSASRIASEADALGIKFDVGGSFDTSYIGISCSPDRLSQSIGLLADLILHPAYRDDEVELIKRQTLAEIATDKGKSYFIASRLLPRLVYPSGHPYSVPLLGNGFEDSVSKATSKDLHAFHRTWVRPDNAMVLVAGDVTLAEIVPLLQRNFGAWQAPSDPIPKKQLSDVVTPSKPRVFLVESPRGEGVDITQRYYQDRSLIVAAGVGPARTDPHYPALLLIDEILGGHRNSRLNLRLRHEKRWSDGIGTLTLETEGPGLFMIRIPVRVEKTVDAIVTTIVELNDLRDRGPTELETDLARGSIAEFGPPIGNGTPHDIVRNYMTVLSYGLPDNYWNTFREQLSAVTPGQLYTAARRLIQPQALVWLILGDVAKLEGRVRAAKIGEVVVIDADGKVIRQ